MDAQTFWEIIDDARDGATDGYAVAVQLGELLAHEEPELICAFEEHTARLMEASYSWQLWGAAYLINGGCSDDGFDYFRGWLFTQGRAVFEGALADPDTLADVVDDEVECGDFLCAASSANKEITGEYLENVGRIVLPELGEGWDFDDGTQMRARYPRLWAKFGWG